MSKKKYTPFVHFLNFNAVFLGGLLYPIYEHSVYHIVIPFLLILNLVVISGFGDFIHTTNKALRSLPLVPEIGLMFTAMVVFFGSVEMLAKVATDQDILQYHRPMFTMLPQGTADWRMAHITADTLRISDPELWWRPKKVFPYNSLGFKGQEVSQEKATGVFRIMTYGDSNTDGPDRNGWPERLQAILDTSEQTQGTEFQVLNAGVAGYSSYQGLLRLRQEIDAFQPDLITVSFGWNDLASAASGPDKSFVAPSPLVASLQKILLQYRSYLALKFYLKKRAEQTGKVVATGPRVALEDYIQNMADFRALARSKNIPILFLTRPYRGTTKQVEQMPGGLDDVPVYNQALLRFGQEKATSTLDIQGLFENQYSDRFVDGCHFNPEGHQIMAEHLFKNLLTRGLLGMGAK